MSKQALTFGYKGPTKSQMRRDIQNAREYLRIIERAIASDDMEAVESWARSLEASASLLACDAVERAQG
jgi:hypothetical protein